jgi:hypothetical protein
MKNHVRIFAALALGCVSSLTARAQLGTGWTSTTETFYIQTSSGCTVTSITGGYQFFLSGHGRAELRFADIPSGSEQFQGNLTVTSMPGDKVAVKQTFEEDNGPWQLLAVRKADSAFYDVEQSGQAKLYTFTVGTQYQVNTILDSGHSNVRVYINGSLVITDTGGGGPIYNKCGAYATSSGTGPCTTQWVNIKFWKGGSPP